MSDGCESGTPAWLRRGTTGGVPDAAGTQLADEQRPDDKSDRPEAASRASVPVVTLVLIAVSVVVAAASRLGTDQVVLQPLFIGRPMAGIPAWQVWRLVTPIFIHFGPMHLLFNMIWTWHLGGMIERRRGPLFVLAIVAATAVPSNLLQYVADGSVFFGGMSGVVYALLGYAAMRIWFNPQSGYDVDRFLVVTSLAWFVLCWSGVIGPIANWAHTGGLVIGSLWGAIDAWQRTQPPGLARHDLAIILTCAVLAAVLWGRDVQMHGEDQAAWRDCYDPGRPEQHVAGCTAVGQAAHLPTAIRVDTLIALANWQDGQQQYDAAIASFSQALDIDRSSAVAMHGRGNAYTAKGDYARALRDYDRAVRADSRSEPVGTASFLNSRCWTRAIVGELDGALQDCNEALALSGRTSAVLDSRGVVYLKLGEFDQAIADFDAALALDQPRPQTRFVRGVARRRKGDTAGGDADIAAAKEENPGV
ncbi:MAG: rhomboid family intramembrane serine protease, partial [Alphaproteobacteria bacterium]|nr:rhomboid family intramembrane serine protease [Alphaproteobacteria bacterium]